jgi:hypothetical protein
MIELECGATAGRGGHVVWLDGARLLPRQRGEFDAEVIEVFRRVLDGSFFALFDIVDGLGRREPPFGVDVIDGRLDPKRIALREQPQMFAAHF